MFKDNLKTIYEYFLFDKTFTKFDRYFLAVSVIEWIATKKHAVRYVTWAAPLRFKLQSKKDRRGERPRLLSFPFWYPFRV